MASSSRIREVEHHSTSACKFESATLSIGTTNNGNDENCSSSSCWKLVADNNNNIMVADYAAGVGTTTNNNDDAIQLNNDGHDINNDSHKLPVLVPCQALAEGTTLRVAPMERTSGGWSPDHFHEHLRLPTTTSAISAAGGIKGGLVVLLEAMAHECLAIALSPYHDYILGKTYVVHFGANGNLQTVLRRHVNYTECIDIAIPSRVCSEEKWISYWIVLQHGKLSAGVGKIPGKHCVGTLDDSMYDMLRSGVDAVKYVGIGNSALKRNARDLRVRNVRVCGIPSHFGLGGIPINEGTEEAEGNNNFKFVNILEMTEFFSNGGKMREVHSMPSDAELLAEYEKERSKARARATKFGIEYHEPPPDAFLKWSEARRLRANPEKGFITGIDTFSSVEKDKALARKRRFALEKRKAEGGGGDEEDGEENENSIDVGEGDHMEDDDDDEKDNIAEWEKAKKDPLPIEQAWDNWDIVKQFRVDPAPHHFLPVGNSSGVDSEDNLISNVVDKNDGSSEMEAGKEFIATEPATLVPTKIHLFSIDWAPFKQIRTDDILSYFRDYGPSYVEWLGEISCNVLFEDKYSAARAFHAMSQELPSPPPYSLSTKRMSNSTPFPGGKEVADALKEEVSSMKGSENDTTDIGDEEGSGMDVVVAPAAQDASTENTGRNQEEEPLPDYGSMGWRFCKWTVRKVSNDRYGRRGTQARVLMRVATSIDVLDDRPTQWPKPPPGFTTKRVLMPWHDFSEGGRRGVGQRDSKRRRRGSSSGKRDKRDHSHGKHADDKFALHGGEHPGLGTGLRSRRSGFTLEEIHAERKAKYAEMS